jgi:hypothetical protein
VNEMICFGSGGEVMSAMKIFLHFRYVYVFKSFHLLFPSPFLGDFGCFSRAHGTCSCFRHAVHTCLVWPGEINE